MATSKRTRSPNLKPPKLPGHLTSAVPHSRVDGRHQLDAKGWSESGRWVNVQSSNVASIRYTKSEHALTVQFLNGAAYKYLNVPVKTAEDMFDANSMGRFVWQRLRDVYPFIKVQSAQKKDVIRKPHKSRRR